MQASRTITEQRTPGLSSNVLKLIAIIAMVLDHAAYLFLPEGSALYSILRFVGRLTGSIMFYMLVEGFHHTRNLNRYMLRMAVFAVISYLPYYYMMNKALPSAQHFASFNVLYTMFIGLLALRVRHGVKNPMLRWVLIGVLVALAVPGDWHYLGMILILMFDYFYGDFDKQAFAASMVILISLLPVLSQPVRYLFTGREFDTAIVRGSLYRLGMFVSLVLLRFYSGSRGRALAGGKWGFYIFYPMHIAVLCLIYYFVVQV